MCDMVRTAQSGTQGPAALMTSTLHSWSVWSKVEVIGNKI